MSDEEFQNSSGDGCPEWNPAWPVGDWPEANQQIGLTLVVIHLIVLVCSLAYMFQHRNQEPYRSRNPGLVALSAFGLATMGSTLSLREYIGREDFPCDLLLWFSFLSIGLWLGPYSVQILQLRNRLDWQQKLSSMPLYLPEGVSFSEYVTSKYRASHTRAFLSMALLCFIMSSLTFIYSHNKPIYYRGCSGCDLTKEEFVIFSMAVIMCLWLIFYSVRILPKPTKGQAAHPLVQQVMHHMKYHVVLYLVYIALIVSDPGQMHENGEFSWNHLVVMLMIMFTFQDVAYPGLLQARTQEIKPKLRLINVIRDPVLLELFENHLMSEFSLENLRFYFEAIAVKRDYPTGNENTTKARDVWCQRAHGIYRRFLANDALLGINVSARIKRKIQQRLDVIEPNPAIVALGTEKKSRASFSRTSWMHADVFDEAVLEVFQLIERDSFGRFYETNKEMLEGLDMMIRSYGEDTSERDGGNSSKATDITNAWEGMKVYSKNLAKLHKKKTKRKSKNRTGNSKEDLSSSSNDSSLYM